VRSIDRSIDPGGGGLLLLLTLTLVAKWAVKGQLANPSRCSLL
jgi:hypothetical protein